MRLDAPYESAGIQCVFWIELVLYCAHQRNVVAGVSPCVDRMQFWRTVQNNESAVAGLRAVSQLFYCRGELSRAGFKPEHSDSCGLENDLPIYFSRVANYFQGVERLRYIRREQADFGLQCGIG